MTTTEEIMYPRAKILSGAILLTFAASVAQVGGCSDPSSGLSTDALGASSSSSAEPTPTTTASGTAGAQTGDGDETAGASGADTSGTGGAASSEGNGGDEPICGDGRPGPGEECDDGEENNGDNELCTESCTINICGDGLLLAGTEDCDHGDANSDEYGFICTKQCRRGVWCGDNVLQPEHEQCDNGPENGASGVDEQGIACDKMCRMKARRVFITKHAFSGDLGGLSGADEKCRKAALDAQLPAPERFMALLSDAGTSMKTRYEDKLGDPMPYVFLTGAKIADSYAALIEFGPGDLGVHVNEALETVADRWVASNTAADGSIYQEFDDQDQLIPTDCDGWSTSDKAALGRFGYNGMSPDAPDYDAWKQDKQWLSWATYKCDWPIRLYCIEL